MYIDWNRMTYMYFDQISYTWSLLWLIVYFLLIIFRTLLTMILLFIFRILFNTPPQILLCNICQYLTNRYMYIDWNRMTYMYFDQISYTGTWSLLWLIVYFLLIIFRTLLTMILLFIFRILFNTPPQILLYNICQYLTNRYMYIDWNRMTYMYFDQISYTWSLLWLIVYFLLIIFRTLLTMILLFIFRILFNTPLQILLYNICQYLTNRYMYIDWNRMIYMYFDQISYTWSLLWLIVYFLLIIFRTLLTMILLFIFRILLTMILLFIFRILLTMSWMIIYRSNPPWSPRCSPSILCCKITMINWQFFQISDYCYRSL